MAVQLCGSLSVQTCGKYAFQTVRKKKKIFLFGVFKLCVLTAINSFKNLIVVFTLF